MRLYDIEAPEQIQYLSLDQLKEIANDIREFLIDSLSKTGGELAKNLSMVDVTMAVHVVFHAPFDSIVFDLGYQCLTHKILTGRSCRFGTLLKTDGLSAFPDPKESRFDSWNATHAGQGLSIAMAFASARDAKNETNHVVCLLEKESFQSGACFEALQALSQEKKKIIIIYNDCTMDEGKHRKGFSNHSLLKKASGSLKTQVNKNKIGKGVLSTFQTVKESFFSHSAFKDFGFHYEGVIDGHDLEALIQVFEKAKDQEGVSFIHVRTIQGYGSNFIKANPSWNVGCAFHKESGRPLFELPKNQMNWKDFVLSFVKQLATKDQKIYPIKTIKSTFNHYFSFAAGLCESGYHPFLSISSNQIMSCLDAIQNNLCFMEKGVVCHIYDAGLIGEKGPIYQGIDDIVHLIHIPQLILAQPKDASECRDLFYTAFQTNSPFFIRTSYGHTEITGTTNPNFIEIGTWSQFQIGMYPQAILISYGELVNRLIDKARLNQLDLLIVNARFLKPIDQDMLYELFQLDLPIYVCEPDRKGGLACEIQAYSPKKIHILGIEDHFVEQASLRTLKIREEVSVEAFIQEVMRDSNAIR